MDVLRAAILILHAQVERERLRLRIAQLEQRPMTPKVQGLSGALKKLHHGLDARAEKLLSRIDAVNVRADGVFDKAHGKLDASEASLKEVEAFVADLEGTNGGPSSEGSGEPSEPHKSWSGDKA